MESKGTPRVSIITPVLNAVSTIEQTIISVLNQSYPNIEHIVVDGRSTDGTVDILKRHERELFLWTSEPDSGISDAFNKGIRKATGTIIGIINADDWYEPDAVERIVEAYIHHPEIDIFYGKTGFARGDVLRLHPTKPLVHIGLFHGMTLAHPSVFVLKKTYNRVGLFNLSYKLAMDYDFLLRSILAGVKFMFIDSHLSNFRAGGLSDRFYPESVKECRISQKLLFENYRLREDG